MERKARERIVCMVMAVINSLIAQGKLKRRENGKILALISDTDGTVGKWQLLISLLIFIGDTFSERKPIIKPLEEAIQEYHQSRMVFGEVVKLALKILPDAIRGLHFETVSHLAVEVAKRYRNRVYQFPKAVLDSLSVQPPESRRLILSITGAPQIIADPFCRALKFDLAIGCEYFVDGNGQFTGERDETPAIRKDEVLKVLAEDCGIDLDESMYMGDTIADLPGLLAVCIKYRWAINPKSELQGAIRRNPGHNIVWVHDHHATGVQFFRALSDGCLHEQERESFLPPDLVEALPRLPGERF
ncbi:MAG: HAD family hydrolase [Patescibacteria group bacterium]